MAAQTGLSRDTLRKIEAGESTLDSKRQKVLDLLGLNDDGLPADVQREDAPPAPALDLDARLNNLDRQVNALWSALGSLPSVAADEVIRKLKAKPGDEDLLQKLGVTDELERHRRKAAIAFSVPDGDYGIEGPEPAPGLAADFEESGTTRERIDQADDNDSEAP